MDCEFQALGMVTQVRYDAELAALRSGVERVVVELVVGPKSSAATRKAILPHVDDLAAFLGRRSASRESSHYVLHVVCDNYVCIEALQQILLWSLCSPSLLAILV